MASSALNMAPLCALSPPLMTCCSLPLHSYVCCPQVSGEDFSNEVCTLQSAAQSFTKADGTLVRLYLNSPAHLQPGKVGAEARALHAVVSTY
jgi:hypothetical protein